MPRMPKKRKLGLSFFLNEGGRVTYNDLCRKSLALQAVPVRQGLNVTEKWKANLIF